MTTSLIRKASPQEDTLIAKHLYQLSIDIGVPAEVIKDNWLDISLQFISHVRQTLSYKAFVAEVDGIVVGSAGCQLYTKPYPQIWAEHYSKSGYVWGVYVESPSRGQGIGKQLTSQAIECLRSLNCTRVLLHASFLGQPIYKSFGFSDSNEMYLDLK